MIFKAINNALGLPVPSIIRGNNRGTWLSRYKEDDSLTATKHFPYVRKLGLLDRIFLLTTTSKSGLRYAAKRLSSLYFQRMYNKTYWHEYEAHGRVELTLSG
ncbi:hypothetical protein PM082_014838 [Marasmius tenuissimus]|nr:hypothetical protein PM082_014838 [Marasmius tenuissimus]